METIVFRCSLQFLRMNFGIFCAQTVATRQLNQINLVLFSLLEVDVTVKWLFL